VFAATDGVAGRSSRFLRLGEVCVVFTFALTKEVVFEDAGGVFDPILDSWLFSDPGGDSALVDSDWERNGFSAHRLLTRHVNSGLAGKWLETVAPEKI
jgi:hypothetical protein